MHLLKLPKYAIDDFYDEMLDGRHNNLKNEFLKTRLLLVKKQLIKSESKYRNLGTKKQLYTMLEHDNIKVFLTKIPKNPIPKIINAKEMEKVYTNFLVDKQDSDKIGREVYNSILTNTDFNLCPYCSHREVKTVDHFLPKSKFISYAITPINLLPCCSDCNKDKLDNIELSADKILIHPYFDDISMENWLECNVVINTWPITFSYSISNLVKDPVLKSRINYQFDLLNLSRLYADNATREFNKRVKSLVKEYNSKPSNKISDFINDNIDSYRFDNPNSWQTKMFEALKKSKWFLDTALPDLESYYSK